MASDDNNFPLSDAERSPEPAPESPSSRLESPITPGYPGPIDPHLPDDLRVPWNWLDLFFLVAVAVSGTIVITLLLIKGFAIFGLSFRQIQKSASDQNLFLIFNQTLLSALLLAYLAAQMRHSFHAPFWRTIGWRPLETGRTPRTAAHLGLILSGFMLAILVTASSAVFKAPKQTPIEQFFQDRRSALLLMTANKIGTYGIAVLAKENNVPFYVAAPISTIDLSLPTGDQIPIEERSPEEVTHAAGIRTAPDVRAAHIAFDVTPARYITAIITENGVAHAPFIDTLPIAVRGSHHS